MRGGAGGPVPFFDFGYQGFYSDLYAIYVFRFNPKGYRSGSLFFGSSGSKAFTAMLRLVHYLFAFMFREHRLFVNINCQLWIAFYTLPI